MTISITEKKLKMLIKEGVKEAINSELMTIRGSLIPDISQKEQKEIEKKYKKPLRKISKTYNVEI